MEENQSYLNEQIITCLGNKRLLLNQIGEAVKVVQSELGKEKLRCGDLFSGSGIVSRYLKKFSSFLWANDLETFSYVTNSCYLENKSCVDFDELRKDLKVIQDGIQKDFVAGHIAETYAPKDDLCITHGERVFYTRRNAIYLDCALREISKLPHEKQKFFLAPLISEASIHANTSGVFKGFYKNKHGVGKFGGEAGHALKRITSEIDLKLPILSNYICDYQVTQFESSDAISQAPELDFIYLDPPYNQHPYGSNYFMLNLIAENKAYKDISPISGIPRNWKRSAFNQKKLAKAKLFSVIEKLPAKYILISYNSEGFIKYDEFCKFLNSIGEMTHKTLIYNTFRGCRNLNKRNLKVKEYMFLLKK